MTDHFIEVCTLGNEGDIGMGVFHPIQEVLDNHHKLISAGSFGEVTIVWKTLYRIKNSFTVGGWDVASIVPVMVQDRVDLERFGGIVVPRSLIFGAVLDADKAPWNS